MPTERRMSQCPPSRVGQAINADTGRGCVRWWWLSRVEGVVRSCDTHFSPGGGNIIEHYVYRFVTVGRACLVSNTAIIPLSFPSSIYIYTSYYYSRIPVKKIITQIFLRVFITRLREENYQKFVVDRSVLNCRGQLPPRCFAARNVAFRRKLRLRGARPQRA